MIALNRCSAAPGASRRLAASSQARPMRCMPAPAAVTHPAFGGGRLRVRTHAAKDTEKKGYLTSDTIATIGVTITVAMFFYMSLADLKDDTAKISTKVDQVLEANRAIQVGEAELRGANEALADIIKGRLAAPATDTAPAAADKN
eukprot:CAMPEP_0202859162 /NCGR_PEP_ID=MMETSP1391-20130828/1401_1 /ASSEMBLY_ACC=CAM_ASM_000867 /TAXON_ID=1034604 /ORGANISM="Chlamydomonas leiostraca, Strain SAG 11-49" /LENGTH=144 /DNA_ID=CAMNT_0049538173 /DNA_START=242 /DNA_END=676 /DNA_ORIENTATION=+